MHQEYLHGNHPFLPEANMSPQEKPEELNYPEIFSYALSEYPVIEHYAPEYLSRGGLNVVYEVPGHPDVIVKVEHRYLKRIADHNTATSGEAVPGVLDEEVTSRLKEYFMETRERQKVLTQYFGKEHTVPFRLYLTQIPVTEKMLKFFWQDAEPPKTETLWSVVMVQKKVDVITEKVKEGQEPQYVSPSHGYGETSGLSPKKYRAITRKLVYKPLDPESEVSINDFYRIHGTGSMRRFLEAAALDEQLQNVTKEFISASIDYSQNTQEILDLFPSGNVVFYKDNGVWTYKMPDALNPLKEVIPEAIEALKRLHKNPHTTEHVFDAVYFLNYARTLNMLADIFLVPKRLDCVPEELKNKQIRYADTLRKVVEDRKLEKKR